MTTISPSEQITLTDAFDVMRRFLEVYWERGDRNSEDIAILLGALNRDEASQSLPLDEALWHDWLEAAKLR